MISFIQETHSGRLCHSGARNSTPLIITDKGHPIMENGSHFRFLGCFFLLRHCRSDQISGVSLRTMESMNMEGFWCKTHLPILRAGCEPCS